MCRNVSAWARQSYKPHSAQAIDASRSLQLVCGENREMVADVVTAGVPSRAAPSARREGWSRRLPLLPAVLVVFAVTQVPFVITLIYSLISWNLFFPTK